MGSNSKKTIWMMVIVGIVIITLAIAYLVMQANRGKELLKSGNAPENVQPGLQRDINSDNPDVIQRSAQPATTTRSSVTAEPLSGINESDLGDLNSNINQLDQDINKL